MVTESDCVLVFHFAFGLDFASAFQVMVLYHGARFRGAAVLPLRGRSPELRERGAFQGCVEEYDFGDTRKYVAYAVVSVF